MTDMGKRGGTAEVQQHQDLVAGEGHPEGLQGCIDPRQHDLLRPHQRGDGRHAVGGVGPAVLAPQPRGLGDRVGGESGAATRHGGNPTDQTRKDGHATSWASYYRAMATRATRGDAARARPPGALRHGCQPVRRPRRRDLGHAPAAAGAGRRGHPPRPRPQRRGRRHRRRPGGRPGGGDLVLPGRARRVLRLSGGPAGRGRVPATSRSTAVAAASSCPAEIEALRGKGVRIFSPADGQRLGPAGHDQRADQGLRHRPVGDRRRTSPPCCRARRPHWPAP